MESDQAAQTSATPSTPSPGLFATKIPATAAFVLAILLFFLPFAELRCNGNAVANNTGLGIAIGSPWKEVVSKNLFGNGFNNNSGDKSADENTKRDPNKFAIAALGLGVIGLLIALLAAKGGGKVNMVVALLAAASLIAMLVDLKSQTKSDDSIKSSELGINASVSVSVDGTAAFYFAVLLFLLAALFSWQRSKVGRA